MPSSREPSPMPRDSDQRTEEFVSLILANQLRIFGFIRSMVPHHADVEDLFQQTSAVLWRKFDEFETGTNFAAWAMRVAHFQIRDYRKKRLRSRGIFDDEVFEAVSEKAAAVAVHADVRQEAMELCLGDLDEENLRLVQMRYLEEMDVAEIADRIGRSTKTVYRVLNQVRESLLHCIRRKLAAGEIG